MVNEKLEKFSRRKIVERYILLQMERQRRDSKNRNLEILALMRRDKSYRKNV